MITQKDTKDMKEVDIKHILLVACIMFMPFLVSTIYLLPIEQNILTVMPCNSDEEFYFNQLKSVLAYGHPLGYYGYAGSHARIGHFGAWGSAWVLPYALVTALTGLNYFSISLTNHILFALCILLAYKMSDKSVLKSAILLGLYFIPTFGYYMNSAMMEGLQFIIGIVSALMLFYMSKNTYVDKYIIILIALAFCYFCACKVMWIILWVPFFYLVTRGKGATKQAFRRNTGSMMIVFYMLHALTASPYFENAYFLERVANMARSKNISETLQFFVIEFKYHIWLTLNAEFSKIQSDLRVLVMIGGLAITLYSLVYGIIEKTLSALIPLVVFGGYIIGTAATYSGGGALLRTVFPGFVFAITYIAMTNNKWLSVTLVAFLFVIAVHTIGMQMSNQYDDRVWYDENAQNEYTEKMNPISEIKVEQDSDAWSNTILWPAPLTTNSSLLYLPSGVGINWYKALPEDVTSIHEGWIMLDSIYADRINDLQKNGYDIYREENGSCLLKKK